MKVLMFIIFLNASGNAVLESRNVEVDSWDACMVEMDWTNSLNYQELGYQKYVYCKEVYVSN